MSFSNSESTPCTGRERWTISCYDRPYYSTLYYKMLTGLVCYTDISSRPSLPTDVSKAIILKLEAVTNSNSFTVAYNSCGSWCVPLDLVELNFMSFRFVGRPAHSPCAGFMSICLTTWFRAKPGNGHRLAWEEANDLPQHWRLLGWISEKRKGLTSGMCQHPCKIKNPFSRTCTLQVEDLIS